MREDRSVSRRLRRLSNLYRLLGPVGTTRFLIAKALGASAVSLRVDGLDHPVLCRPADSDVRCLWQVFGLEDCRCDLPAEPRLIVDGGANVGYATLYYAARYPNAVIVAVEPDPSNVEMIRRNTAHLDRVRIVQSAIWDRDVSLRIANPDDESWRFRVEEVEPSAPRAFPARTVQSVIDEAGIGTADLVKLDIEGAEKRVFASPERLGWLAKARAVVVECHGAEAEAIVERAMSGTGFCARRQGEKLLYVRDPSGAVAAPVAAGPAGATPLPE